MIKQITKRAIEVTESTQVIHAFIPKCMKGAYMYTDCIKNVRRIYPDKQVGIIVLDR